MENFRLNERKYLQKQIYYMMLSFTDDFDLRFLDNESVTMTFSWDEKGRENVPAISFN